MRLVAVVTDYIRRSILTTQGDLVVRGVSQPERLAAGIVGTLLKGKGAGAIPAFEDLTGALGTVLQGRGAGVEPTFGVLSPPTHNTGSGVFTRSTGGDLVVAGLGFNPYLVFFGSHDSTTSLHNWSFGVDDKVRPIFVATFSNGADGGAYINYSIFLHRNASNRLYGHISASGSDGFTITFALAGTCSVNTAWLALG